MKEEVLLTFPSQTSNTQNLFSNKLFKSIPGLDSIKLNLSVFQFTFDSQLVPPCNCRPSAPASCRENGIKLLEGEGLYRVRFIDNEGEPVKETILPVASASNRDAKGIVSENCRKGANICRLEFAGDE